MARTRLILAALMGLTGYGIYATLQSSFEDTNKIPIAAALLLLFLPAATLLSITFIALNEAGELRHGSLAWRYFANFYTEKVKDENGGVVQKVMMPSHLRLCPSYWMVCVGFIAITAVLLACVLVIAFVGSLTKGGLLTASDALAFTLFAAGVFASIIGIAVLFGALSAIKRRWLRVASYALAGGTLLCVLFIWRVYYLMHVSWMQYDQAVQTAISGGVYLLLFFVLCGVAVAVLLGIVTLITRLLPWLRHSIIGRIFSAIYHGLCPIIPISSPEETPAEETVN